jgi:ankyrin repeat protein
LLLSHGGNVNQPADYGLTPLHIAAKGNNTEIVRLLIEANAAPDSRDSIGNTPLITACKYGNSGAARLLIESNADTKLTDKNGISALSAAENNGLTEIIILLKKA